MQVVVVNELLSGGWLEFLGNVRLRDDEGFDAARALERCAIQPPLSFPLPSLRGSVSRAL